MANGLERDWLAAENAPELKETQRPEATQFELRPLSLGEILDRTFSLYRSRFWLFASISAVSAVVQVLVQAISLTTAHALLRNVALEGGASRPAPVALRSLLHAQVGAYAAGLVFFLVAAVTQAATSRAMGDVYLGKPTSAKDKLAQAGRLWYRWVGIALWTIGSFLWAPALAMVPAFALIFLGSRSGNTTFAAVGGFLAMLAVFAGIPVGVIFYLRNALAIPAGVVERLPIRAAMRRSKVLAAGTKGRIFVVILIAFCLLGVVGALESPATFLIMAAPKQEHYLAQAIALLVSFLGRTLVTPVAMIGLTTVYFDQRVRKEALDLELLLEGNRRPSTMPVTEAGVREGSPFA